MAVAQPVLEAIGARLGSGREAILVPGNHDRRLVGSWVRAQGSRLAPDAVVPVDATPGLARVTSWLAPARVRVHYPGVWLSDRVWATHGHYLDRHLLPTSAFGSRARIARPPAARGGAAGRLRAGRRPLGHACGGVAHALAPAAAGDDGRGSGRATACGDDAPRAQATAASADGAVAGRGARHADAPREHPGAGAGDLQPRRRRRLGAVRARAPARAARRATSNRSGMASPAAPGSRTRARGCTSRCCCTGRHPITRTGREVRCCSTTARTRRRSRCSATSRPQRCTSAQGSTRWLSPNSCHR